jgi:hypothetical protein
MKLFAFVLVGLLLVAPGAAQPTACSCDGRALCIVGDDAGADLGAALSLPVTLELRSGGTNKQLSDELSRIAGKRIAVLPSKPDEAVNVDIKKAPLWDVLESFSMRGLVTIEEQDFSKLQSVRKALAGGEKISVCIKGAALGRVVGELSGLSGQRLRVTSGDEKALVNLSAKGLTLEGIISRLSAQTSAQIGAK